MQKIPISHDRELIYKSPQIQAVIDEVNLFAPTDHPVLITGENGTGKENIARLIHQGSKRKDHPFSAINCAAISPNLIESELFGHEKGAFTGADKRRIGAFEAANGGTIFLDEIGEMSPELQVKLLRVLQDGQFNRVGGSETITAKPRIVAATNKNLEDAMHQGKFRKDLYFRLCGVEINLPDLKDRPLDIPLLAEYFAHKTAEKYGMQEPAFAPQSLDKLLEHHWPGNVRELENVIAAAAIRAQANKGVITPEMLRWRPEKAGESHEAAALPAARAVAKGPVEDSFGYILSNHREGMGLTQTALARKVSDHAAAKVSDGDVKQWEANQQVPDGDVVNALALILIVNGKKADEDKARDMKAFFEAAETARDTPAPAQSDTSFAEKVRDLREAAGLTQVQLASMATSLSGAVMLEQKDIYLIESGHPARALDPKETLALVKALDQPDHPLSVNDKLQLYEGAKRRFSAVASPAQAKRDGQEARTLKDLLTKNGTVSILSIANDSGVARGTVKDLMEHGNHPGVVEKLAAYLQKRDGDCTAFMHLLLERDMAKPGTEVPARK